jgi:hypothetical protein
LRVPFAARPSTTWHRTLGEEGFATTGSTRGVSGAGALDTVTLRCCLCNTSVLSFAILQYAGSRQSIAAEAAFHAGQPLPRQLRPSKSEEHSAIDLEAGSSLDARALAVQIGYSIFGNGVDRSRGCRVDFSSRKIHIHGSQEFTVLPKMP